MYKVFYDDQLLYLPGDQELIIFNTKLELADNKSGSFEFDIPAVNPMYDKMKKLTSVIRVEKDGDSIFYGRILSMEKNFYNTRTVRRGTCLSSGFDTGAEGIPRLYCEELLEYPAGCA